MKKIKIEQTGLMLALALALSATASAQTAQQTTNATPAATVETEPSYGLLGEDYSEVDFGYQNSKGSPGVFHDYGFTSNANIEKGDTWGFDGDFKYDYLTGGASGFHDYRNDAEFGGTEFLAQSWGRPFIEGDIGWAWQRAGGEARDSLAYEGTAGVEFQVLKHLVLTPYVEYQAEPRLRNDLAALADLPNHDWDFGVKATYRLTRQISASLGASIDQYNGRDWGYRAGLTYHY